MKRILYLILKKDMIKRLQKKHGYQFIDDVMETFGMPTDFLKTENTIRETLDKYKQKIECEKSNIGGEHLYSRSNYKCIFCGKKYE